MKKQLYIFIYIILFVFNFPNLILAADIPDAKTSPQSDSEAINEPKTPIMDKKTHNSWYFSWGYNREHWGNSDIHIKQMGLGNNFVIHDVEANDRPSSPFSSDLTEPQYNIRIGHFINEDHTLALEFSFDHTKYNNVIGQNAHITGTINNQSVDMNQILTNNYFYYVLHNGANHIMFNFVKISPLLGENEANNSLSAVSKAGMGILFPHSENTILNNPNSVGGKNLTNCCGMNHGWWQINGWTVGVEFGLRYMFYNPFYLEATAKEAFGKLYNVPVYQGTAEQNLWMTEGILNLGFIW